MIYFGVKLKLKGSFYKNFFMFFVVILLLLTTLYSQEHLFEARYYVKLEKKTVRCVLCPRSCVLKPGQVGYCRVRKNINGKLYSLVYGRPVSAAIDPIEKKPVFHMLPGSKSFSFATVGCNLRCIHCQNWQISQALPEDIPVRYVPPETIIEYTIKTGCKSISYTYTEPTVFFEYMIDIAKLAKQRGIKNVWVTSGYINKEPLIELCKYLDVARVDLKGFSDEFYQKIANTKLKYILENLKLIKEQGVFIEVVNLIIPGYNDNFDEIREMCIWIKENLGADTPVFFSRFFPHHKLSSHHPTPISTLKKAREIALEVGLKFIYIGNVSGQEGEDTFCPKCKKVVIDRLGYTVLAVNLNKSKCKYCDEKISGIWD